MAARAQSNQIAFVICALLAAQFLVVDLEIVSRAADLASPTISLYLLVGCEALAMTRAGLNPGLIYLGDLTLRNLVKAIHTFRDVTWQASKRPASATLSGCESREGFVTGSKSPETITAARPKAGKLKSLPFVPMLKENNVRR